MANIVIENTRPTQITLPPHIQRKGQQKGKVLHDAQPLLPGENNVDADYWNFCKERKGVKPLIALKYLVNLGEGEAKELGASIDNLPDDQALAQIEKCDDIQILNDWKVNSQKPGIRRAIEERVQELVANADGGAPPSGDGDQVTPVS